MFVVEFGIIKIFLVKQQVMEFCENFEVGGFVGFL